MSESVTMKWAVIRGGLYLSNKVSVSDEIVLSVNQMPESVTIAQVPATGEIDLSTDIFGSDDDGLNFQRASLLKYRVLTAILEGLPSQEALYRAKHMNYRSLQIENDIDRTYANMYGADTQVIGYPKGDDIYG